jgi:hypothetical protein
MANDAFKEIGIRHRNERDRSRRHLDLGAEELGLVCRGGGFPLI